MRGFLKFHRRATGWKGHAILPQWAIVSTCLNTDRRINGLTKSLNSKLGQVNKILIYESWSFLPATSVPHGQMVPTGISLWTKLFGLLRREGFTKREAPPHSLIQSLAGHGWFKFKCIKWMLRCWKTTKLNHLCFQQPDTPRDSQLAHVKVLLQV